jgi:folate-binding protein YgfZ
MNALLLRELHRGLGAQFTEVGGAEAVAHYGDPLAEHAALRQSAGVLDLGFRGRLCLTGADRVRFLHGQVTNNVKDLDPGDGCYAALVTAKGRLVSDLNIYCLPEELLLDFEPGLTATLVARFEKYIIADDVQVVDVAPLFGLFSVQGPKAAAVAQALDLGAPLPAELLGHALARDPKLGELHVMNHPRGRTLGFDLFVPVTSLPAVMERLVAAARAAGGRACGWQALEMLRIEAGIPRFGADMDDTTLPPEAGIESRAVSYSKGCYVGQEVIARIRTYGHVNRLLRGLRLADHLPALPQRGDKLVHGGHEVGHITSAVASPALKANVALGYVRREQSETGTALVVRSAGGESPARVVPLPFVSEPL